MAKKEKTGFFAEFKKFITRGNVVDLAVGVIIGGAFTAIVNALSNNILRPIINWLLSLILPGEGLSSALTFFPNCKIYTDVLNDAGEVIGKEIDLANSIYIDWGAFISAVINFLLIAVVLFLLVRLLNRLKDAQESNEKVFNRKKEIFLIMATEKVKKSEAVKRYEQRVAEEKLKAEEEARIAEEKAAEEARLAEEKANAHVVLLAEIRDLLKNK